MKITLSKIKGSWRAVADTARNTVGKAAGAGTPASSWKRKIILAEHSPIRKMLVEWKWEDLLWWVQTHFTRHKFGVEWFVQTSRTDRAGVDRVLEGSQSNLINVMGEANFQAIINISRKRLCQLASFETRAAWLAVLNSFKDTEPELYAASVPDCVYRGHCFEFPKSCGYFRTEYYKAARAEYIAGINTEVNQNGTIN